MGSAGPPVRVEVLGPLRLLVDGRAVDVRGQKRRAALALLALAEGRTVTADHLVDALWPDAAPESGRAALHTHVSRLRTHLGAAAPRLETRQEGYRLDLGPDGLDAARARTLLASARTGTTVDGSLETLREAHALWRGPVLADLTAVAAIAAAVEGFAHLHREITDALVARALAAGHGDEVMGLAVESAAADPLREPAVLLLMRVLATTGRAAAALQAGREYRERLAAETGLDPSPALDELVRDIAAGRVSAPAPVIAGAPGPPSPAAPRQAEPPSPAPSPGRAETRLFGRDNDIVVLHRLLGVERLVTLVGPGGVGKTRVALAVAQPQARSEPTAAPAPTATVLRLAPVAEPAAIPYALAAALGLSDVHGDVLAACVAVLGDDPGLLVVDNCEHLLDPVRDTVGALLSACPRLSVLATSREPLGLATEYVFRLPPLALPAPDQDPRQAPAVAVFLDRAGRVRPDPVTPADLALVAAIVRRLDGMPLAIELAAGRLSTFSVADLHERLDRALDLLGGRPSGEARHATLRETVEWSYRLLSEDEQRFFRHLSVFTDGVNLATAERIGADLDLTGDPGSVLARLVDASMLDVSFGEQTSRYRMLETLRVFGLDRLTATGEADAAAERLLRWAVGLTAWVRDTMATEREPEADAVLRRELPNLRTAWRLARDRGAIDETAAIVTALFDAISYRDLVEIRDWAEDLAEDPRLVGHARAAEVLATAGEAAYHRGDYLRAERLARASQDRATDSPVPFGLAVLAVAALARGAFDEVVAHYLAAGELTPPSREMYGGAALATAYAGDLDRARALNARGLTAAVSPTMRAWGEYVAGEIENRAMDAAEPDRRVDVAEAAQRHYVDAIESARSSGASFLVGVATVGLLSVQARAGRVHDALEGYREVIDYFARTGNWTHQWTTLRNLADLLRRLGDDEPAAVLDAAADQAPDAPATDSAVRPGHRPAPTGMAGPSRAAVLDIARQAIARNLASAPSADPPTAGRRTLPR